MSEVSTCPLCNRKSLLIYPVRYAIACPGGAEQAPGLSGNFKIPGTAPQAVAAAKYTLRALRPGYLYTYDEKNSKAKAYMVLEDNLLWNFPIEYLPPHPSVESTQTASCTANGKRQFLALGSCIDVDENATDLWIGWSNVLWTKDLVRQITDLPWRKLHMQCINIPAMIGGKQTDTGEFETSKSRVSHFAMNAKAFHAAFDFSNRSSSQELMHGPLVKPIGEAMAQSPHKKGYILAVNDPVGITNDLSELLVPSVASGFNEELYWKNTTATLIRQAEVHVRAMARQKVEMSYAVSKTIGEANQLNSGANTSGEQMGDYAGLYRLMKSWAKTGSLDKADKLEEERAKNLPKTIKEAEDEAWEETSTEVKNGKREKTYDETAAKNAEAEYKKALEAFKPKLKALADAHAAWVTSTLLHDWMTGNHDPKDIRSGYAFSESFAQTLGKGVGSEACDKILRDWLNQPNMKDTKNLFARALMFNQTDLIQEADKYLQAKEALKQPVPEVPGSAIAFESFLNIYKQSFLRVKGAKGAKAPNLVDKLLITVGNLVIEKLTSSAKSAGYGLILIRMKLMSNNAVKVGKYKPVQLHNWILNRGKETGVKFDQTQAEMDKIARALAGKAAKDAAANPYIVGYWMDIKQIKEIANIDETTFKELQIPGAETARNWLGSSSAEAMNLGIVTFLVQTATFVFARDDFNKADQFSHSEALKKYVACFVNYLGNAVETIGDLIEKGKMDHPLSAFLLKHWAGLEEHAEGIARIGRILGGGAGIFLAILDFMNSWEVFKDGNKTLAGLYFISGLGGAYLGVMTIVGGSIPFFWPILIATILVGIAIAMIKESALKDWISRCKFGKGEKHYISFVNEMQGYCSAMEG